VACGISGEVDWRGMEDVVLMDLGDCIVLCNILWTTYLVTFLQTALNDWFF